VSRVVARSEDPYAAADGVFERVISARSAR
jgi:hypothetical protein